MKKSTSSLALALVLILGGASGASASKIDPLLTSRASERWPGRYDGLLVWSQAATARPEQYSTYARVQGSKTRLNDHGTVSASVDVFRNRIVYQQARPDKNRSDLYMRHGVDGEPTKTASRRGGWEWSVRISGNYLLFLRGSNANFDGKYQYGHKLILHNLRSGKEKVLDRAPHKKIAVGDITGDWAAWSTYSKAIGWQVHRYNIPSGDEIKVDYTLGTGNYSPTVNAKGVVYFSNTTNPPDGWTAYYDFCGEPRIVKRAVDGSYSVMKRFGRGLDAEVTLEEGRKGVHMLLERYQCPKGPNGKWKSDIYSWRP